MFRWLMGTDKCGGNCITCGRCENNLPILDRFDQADNLEPCKGYGIAIDIGTTTVVMTLADLTTGAILARHSFLNPQRAFGPDVISRIDAANTGSLTALNQMLTQSITAAVGEMLASKGISPADAARVTIAGNTTMTYLLLGFSCESLGRAPFNPAHKVRLRYGSSAILGALSCETLIFPHLAAFIGGDITAGLLHTKAFGAKCFILIDLGTNSEMALYNNGGIIITATAAGPAFEAVGKGGASGVISMLAGMLKSGALDETGLLNESARTPPLVQKQIRELQLAKSAIRAGLEVLLKDSGLSYTDLDALYLAGGIGQAIDPADACTIGLIPDELQGKAIPVGNAALGGAVSLLLAPSAGAKAIDCVISAAKEINLAARRDFNEFFMEHMSF